MGSMMVLRAHTRDGPEVLVYELAPWPTPGEGEALVTVHAAAITFDELTWPETWAPAVSTALPSSRPTEFSGVVAALGDGVTELSAGDEVYGLVPFDRDGAAAEYVSVPATSVAARPRAVSHVVGAVRRPRPGKTCLPGRPSLHARCRDGAGEPRHGSGSGTPTPTRHVSADRPRYLAEACDRDPLVRGVETVCATVAASASTSGAGPR